MVLLHSSGQCDTLFLSDVGQSIENAIFQFNQRAQMAEACYGASDVFVDVLLGDPLLCCWKRASWRKVRSEPFGAAETAAPRL